MKKKVVKKVEEKRRFEFPKGNDYWNRRSKHGRNKLFASPELMWEAACEYFKDTDKSFWKKKEVYFYQGIHKIVSIPLKTPYTLVGLCLHIQCSISYFRTFKKIILDKEAEKVTDEDRDFLTVIEHIEQVIEKQQFEGATVELFNSNIIARKLGLIDKQEIDSKNINYNTEITKDEAKTISDALENDI